MCLELEGGDRRERWEGKENLQEEHATRSLPTSLSGRSPAPRGSAGEAGGPRPLEAAGFVRSGTAGSERRNSASPGGEATVTRAEDHLWHQTQAGPLRCLRTGGRACPRAHIPASARNSHAPGPVPARRQTRLPRRDLEGPRRRL